MTSLTHLLEPLIGQRLSVGQRSGIVIEVMTNPPALIMQAEGRADAIQSDHLGRPQSLTQATWTQSLYGESGQVLHPDLQRQIEPALAQAINTRLTQLQNDRE